MLFSFVLVYISEDWHFSVQPIDIWYNLICSLCRIQLTDSHIIHLIILDRTAYFVSSEISSFFWDEDILTSMVTLLLKYKRILQGVIIPLSEIRESVLESSDGQLVTVCLKHLPQLYSWLSGWRSLTHSPLFAATRVRNLASACEMVMWSPSQTGRFPPGTPVSSHTNTIQTQTSVPMSMINISCITCFIIFIK